MTPDRASHAGGGVLDAVNAARLRLRRAGVDSPRHDAEALLAYVVGVPRSRLALVPAIDPAQQARYDELVALRASRVPLQHITGVTGFRRLDLVVGPGVFLPRPETEVMTGWAIAAVAGMADPLVVDLCTGCGAVALSIAHEAPRARVHAVEREPTAIGWAGRNAAAQEAAGDRPITLHRGDVADPALLADLAGTVDLVTANPPYVPDGGVLPVEVARHDPAAALWGGPDGLAAVREVERAAARLLRPGGQVAVEHADVQGEAVPAIFTGAGRWTEVADHPDLAGRPRFTTARRTARGRDH
jgi:release factor glutamine methyltransferase